MKIINEKIIASEGNESAVRAEVEFTLEEYNKFKKSLQINMEDIRKIIETLNAICGTSYKATTQPTIRSISARLSEGYTLDDFRHVICFKSEQWSNDPNMRQYLRPDTLFGTKFESYLQAAKKVKSAPEKPILKNYKPEVVL